jgi:hypothetical protein
MEVHQVVLSPVRGLVITEPPIWKNSAFKLVSGSVADPDSGSGAFVTPGYGIRNRFFRIPDPKPIFLRA